VDGLSTLPWVGESLVGASTDITCDERVHGFSGHLCGCCSRTGDLSDLCVEHSLLVGVDFEGSKHVNLLDEQRRRVFLSKFLCNGSKDPC
jgi:hypothetical protein